MTRPCATRSPQPPWLLPLLPVAAAPAVARSGRPGAGARTPEVIGGALLGGRGDVVAGGPGVDRTAEVRPGPTSSPTLTPAPCSPPRAPHVLHRPASTLKTLTALTALREGIAPEAAYTARPRGRRVEGTRVGLVRGQHLHRCAT